MRGQRYSNHDQVDDFGRDRRKFDGDKASRFDRDGERDYKRRRSDSRDKHVQVDRSIRPSNSYGPPEPRMSELKPSSTLVLKGISGQTTEQALNSYLAQYNPKNLRLMTRDGESRHFAFVDFHSVDQAELFMKIFAGSAGDPNAAQLIIENRAVTLEYARDSCDRPQGSHYGGSDSNSSYRNRERDDRDFHDGSHVHGSGIRGGGAHSAGLDWICSSCKGHNFSRRGECYRCSAKRTPACVSVPRGSGPSAADGAHRGAMRVDDLENTTPSAHLIVRGLSPSADEEFVSSLFRPFAMVKSVALFRDPCSQFATHLGYIEFYSSEHAQYALQSYNQARGVGNSDIHGGASAAAFANVKAMQRLQKEVAQPGSALAHNPMVAQALQIAQWSANIGTSTAVPTAPPALAPVLAYPPLPPVPAVASGTGLTLLSADQHQQQQQYAQYALFQQQALQAQQQAMMIQQQLRWPPHFETNGGAYVYQAKTGYFLEPTSDFYFDPKSKLYYCGKNGSYYSYDDSVSPPFRRFVPAPPASLLNSHTTASVSDAVQNVNQAAGPSTVTSAVTAGTSAGTSSAPTAAATATAAASSTKVTLGLKTSVGFGLSSLKNKKVKVDLAKWSALQQDDEEDEPAATGKEKVVSQEGNPSAGKTLSTNGTGNRVDSNRAPEIQVDSKRPLEDTADAFLAEFKASTGAISIPAAAAALPSPVVLKTSAPPPPPLPPCLSSVPVPTTATVVTMQSAAAAAVKASDAPTTKAPVCLLCQRQFPSFEMLQRHEKESKLHADNLKKSLGLV